MLGPAVPVSLVFAVAQAVYAPLPAQQADHCRTISQTLAREDVLTLEREDVPTWLSSGHLVFGKDVSMVEPRKEGRRGVKRRASFAQSTTTSTLRESIVCFACFHFTAYFLPPYRQHVRESRSNNTAVASSVLTNPGRSARRSRRRTWRATEPGRRFDYGTKEARVDSQSRAIRGQERPGKVHGRSRRYASGRDQGRPR